VITIGFGVLALPFMLMAKAAPGDQLQQALTQSLPAILVSVILLGPLIEEMIFRGWLTGTWRSFTSSALFLGVFFGGAPLITKFFGGPLILEQLILVGLGLITICLLAPIDRGTRVSHYERAFPFLFWGQGIVFGILHYQNVAAGSAIISLLSTLPLIACGWLWGYARIALGLNGAVVLHAAYNVPAAFGVIILMMMHPS
jgi:membrane protease YdiL (CAAX protease family)